MSREFDKLKANIETKVGLTIAQIQSMSLTEYREYCEAKLGKPLRFVTEFPYIGRGNVLRGGIITSSDLNSEIDRILVDD